MIYTKDHKTLNMFDSLDHLGPKRRSTWSNPGLFYSAGRYYRMLQWIRFCHITLLTMGHQSKNFNRYWVDASAAEFRPH